jgi:hypothetical protein
MNITRYKIKCTFITPVLGAQPTIEVASEYIAARHEEISGILPDDEARSLPQELERGTTVFHKDEQGMPVFWDYQIKGFIKEAAKTFNGLNGVKALRSKVSSLVFVTPRRILLNAPGGLQSITYCERPLRGETAQGPRVALARSEQLPEGTWFEIVLEVIDGPIDREILAELFDYGKYNGLGQWRSGSKGRFTFEMQ